MNRFHKLPTLESMLWGVLFAIAHSQISLYSGNQNSYLLHAVVNANGGTLSQDWFAGTRDAFPLFTWLSASLIRLSPFLLHAAYYTILTVAGMAFWHIIRHLTPRSGWQGRTLVMAALTLLFSMELNFRTQHLPAPLDSAFWTGGLANQYLLGGIFQPSVFGAFLLAAVALHLNNRPKMAVAALIATTAFHFSFILSAGSLLLAIAWTLWREENQPRLALILTLSGGLALLALATANLWRFAPTSPDAFTRAQSILFTIRLPHHADPRIWWTNLSWLKLALITFAIVLCPARPLRRLMLSGIAVAAVVWTAFAITRSPSLGLIFPWRISVILMPLSLILLASALVERLALPRVGRLLVTITAIAATAVCLYAALCGARGLASLSSTRIPKWHALGAKIRAHLEPHDVILIAPHMEEVRLNTGIPVWVDRKNHPCLDTEVLEWRHRLLAAEAWFSGKPEPLATADPAKHIRWVLVDGAVSTLPDIQGLTLVERINSYRLYRWTRTP